MVIKKARPPRIFNDKRGPYILIRRKNRYIKKYIKTNIDNKNLVNIFINSARNKSKRKRGPPKKLLAAMKAEKVPKIEEDTPFGPYPANLKSQLELMKLRSWLASAGPYLQGNLPPQITNTQNPSSQTGAVTVTQGNMTVNPSPVTINPQPIDIKANIKIPPQRLIKLPRYISSYSSYKAPKEAQKTKIEKTLFPGSVEPAIKTSDIGEIPLVGPGQPGPVKYVPPLTKYNQKEQEEVFETQPTVTKPGPAKVDEVIELPPEEERPAIISPEKVDLNKPVPGEESWGFKALERSNSTKEVDLTLRDLISPKQFNAINRKSELGGLVSKEIINTENDLIFLRALYQTEPGKRLLSELIKLVADNKGKTKAQLKNIASNVIAAWFQKELNPPGGKSKRGLWDYEINAIMAPYRPYGWSGCISSDQIGQINPGKHKVISFIVNTSPVDRPGRHWCSVYIDISKDRSVNFFDSYGKDPSPEMEVGLKTLVDKMGPRTLLRYRINRVRAQSWTSDTCGWHCMRWLADMYAGIPFASCTGYDKIISNVKEGEQRVKDLKAHVKKFGYI